MEKYGGQPFDSILRVCPHTRARRLALPRQDKTSQGQAWLAWHGTAWFGMVCLRIFI